MTLDLEKGRIELARRMEAARKRNILQMNCNGREDCKSEHHLCICLSQKKKS